MRLIDADEAIINFGFEWDDISPTRDEFVEFIKKQPTIEAEPVKRGRFVMLKYPLVECSECKEMRDCAHQCGWNYCPNCGAKMAGERKD